MVGSFNTFNRLGRLVLVVVVVHAWVDGTVNTTAAVASTKERLFSATILMALTYEKDDDD
jgi:hypothetical protein